MAEATETKQEAAGAEFKLHPIGKVEKQGKVTRLRIFEKYAAALKGLEGFSHVWAFYWFDKNDTPQRRGILQVHPRGDRKNPLTGVFACRAPVRPNLIALSLCKIVSVAGGVVQIDTIDAFDGTPILDLKPYCPGPDRPRGEVRLPAWITGK
jgi:tRNA-Thr(GGU) m(6)t(6)A37 methyltransferase TsaA